ncbi:MAG: decarboxylase [Clostridiales bacterium]|nr:decarboxylase [Clostridiales bacterium]
MTREDLLLSRLERYAASDMAPMHMPGHKRRTDLEGIREFPNPYEIDITEIEGFDNLHHPEGILKDSMEWASSVYGSDWTRYLVNGSSCGILSAIGAMGGGEMLLARNCHKSAYHGVILNHRDIRYVYPQFIETLGINGGISANDVDKLLLNHPEISSVLLTSPTYDGIVSDVHAIAEAVHRHGAVLIVDEAHGAHFSFCHSKGKERSAANSVIRGEFPESALCCGADIVIQSLHKTLPSLTQTALIHVRGSRVDVQRLEYYLQIFQSSSPSYVLMSSIESCIFEMWKHGEQHMKAFAERIRALRERLTKLQNLRLIGRELIGRCSVYEVDLSKIVISCRGCAAATDKRQNLSGETLSRWLRSQYHIEMEMCGADYVVAITTFLDRQENLDRLADALLEIDGQLVRLNDRKEDGWRYPEPEIVRHMADAISDPWEEILLNDCLGRISTEFVYLYPPGIPILAPGERITEGIFHVIEQYRDMGLPLQGMSDRASKRIRVVREEGRGVSGAAPVG